VKRLIWLYHFLIVTMHRLSNQLSSSSLESDFRILLYHEIDRCEDNRFAEQLDSCGEKWNFIDPNSLKNMFTNQQLEVSPKVMLTFDDGTSSDFRVAQEILNPRGIKAVFFVIPEFVDLVSDNDQEDFIANKLYPGVRNRRRIPLHLRSMDWNQIKILSSQGHSIGSHTTSHRRLSELDNRDDLQLEIVQSKKIIENAIGNKIEHFAFPFGNLSSISPIALKIACDNYNFVYSGLRGSNLMLQRTNVLRRETVHPWDPIGFETAVLDGAADSKYRKGLSIIDSWNSSSAFNGMGFC
jgi:peptidoglycan/xylan/chitin deacetylase (PgdA/CDA1 family)